MFNFFFVSCHFISSIKYCESKLKAAFMSCNFVWNVLFYCTTEYCFMKIKDFAETIGSSNFVSSANTTPRSILLNSPCVEATLLKLGEVLRWFLAQLLVCNHIVNPWNVLGHWNVLSCHSMVGKLLKMKQILCLKQYRQEYLENYSLLVEAPDHRTCCDCAHAERPFSCPFSPFVAHLMFRTKGNVTFPRLERV